MPTEGTELLEATLTPEEKWNKLSKEAKIIAQAVALSGQNSTVETIKYMVRNEFSGNEEAMTKALLELNAAGVLNRLSARERDEKIIEEFEEGGPAGHGTEARRLELQVAKKRLASGKSSPDYDRPYFSISKDFKPLVNPKGRK